MITEMTQFSSIDMSNVKLEHTAELKPCPFCGGEAKAQYAPGAYGITGIKVKCTKCRIATVTEIIGAGRRNTCGEIRPISEVEAFNDAVSCWNNRVAEC